MENVVVPALDQIEGVNYEVMPEFRLIVRRKTWPPDSYLQVQLKSTDWSQGSSEKRQFKNCEGYDGMLEQVPRTLLPVAENGDRSGVKHGKGNQTIVDCTINGITTQAKSYIATPDTTTVDGKKKDGDSKFNSWHKTSSTLEIPYDAGDGFDQMVETLIVKSNGKFYLLYAVQSKQQLVDNGVF